MPLNVIVALVLLLLIYAVALANSFMYNRRVGIITIVTGLIALFVIFVSHACLNTGGCSLIGWLYVLVYLAVLMALIFFSVLMFVDENPNIIKTLLKAIGVTFDHALGEAGDDETHDSDEQEQQPTANKDQDSRVNDNIRLKQTDNPEEYIENRKSTVNRMFQRMKDRRER